jgi:oligoribonuclease NrnB/cAMP/cGMP phosphodiesterase (DHH superfamily)
MTYCIYHNKDLDGFASGAIVNMAYQHPEVRLIGYDYEKVIPFNFAANAFKEETLYIVDCSFSLEQTEILCNNFAKVVWIDHHKSAIEELKDFTHPNFKNHSKVGMAACELVWEYFNPSIETPEIITLLGIYDSWRKENQAFWDNDVLPFQFGMRVVCNSVETFPTWTLLDEISFYNRRSFIGRIKEQGRAILKYQENSNLFICKSAFEDILCVTEDESYRVIMLNSVVGNSDMFNSVYNSSHDMMCRFSFNGTEWSFTLYSTKPNIDCGVIAKKLGGGGHKGAAGFKMTPNEASKSFCSFNIIRLINT